MGKIMYSIEQLVDSKIWPFVKMTMFFALTFILYVNYITDNLIPLNGDGLIYLNIEEYASRSILNGEYPLWNPYLSAGRPFINDVTNFFFSPVRILFFWLPTKWFFYSFYSFHLAMGAIAFSLYLKVIGCNKWIAELMSILYYFSICLGGYRKTHLLLIACSVYLPIILYFIEKYYKEKQMKYLLISSLFLAFQFFTGFPQYALYTDIIAGIYLIVLEYKYKYPFLSWLRDGIMWIVFYIGFSLIQLIPFCELWLTYVRYGSVETSLEQFKSYSINAIKLLLMFCPTLFSSHPNSALMDLGCSELQAELFMGTVAFSIIILSVWKFRKDYYVKISLLFMTGIFLFAISGTVDVLAKIIYHIPILGSFRCSSRILFAYSYFGLVVVARGIELLIVDNKYVEVVKVYIIEIVILILIAVLICPHIGIDISEIMNRYAKTFVVLTIAAIGTYMINKVCKNQVICIIILVFGLIIWDVYPYWKESSTCNADELKANDEVEEYLVTHSDEGKVIIDSPYIDGQYQSVLSTNNALSLGIQSINSYTNLNDPRLSLLMTSESLLRPSFNYSGIYTGFPEISKVLRDENGLLSMLGIKYIVDQEGNVPREECLFGDVIEVVDTLVPETNLVIPQTSDIYVVSIPIDLNAGENYKISFECDAGKITVDEFYLDFYSVDDYDNAEQQVNLNIDSSQATYEFVVNAGEVPETANDVVVRIIACNSSGELTLKNFTVKKVKCEKIDNPYELVLDVGNVKIYQNKKARSILYIPDQVASIENMAAIYKNSEKFDLANVSYIEADEAYVTGKTTISNVHSWINGVTATVDAESRTFVNFSQAYFPGWKAYIDGEETAVFEVNGYIQGVEVEEGHHLIKYVYVPVLFYIGCVGTVFFLLVWFVIIFRKKKSKW